jgi:hypothetical protein
VNFGKSIVTERAAECLGIAPVGPQQRLDQFHFASPRAMPSRLQNADLIGKDSHT